MSARATRSEHDEQAEVVRWARSVATLGGKYACLDLLYAIPNAGRRSYALAAYMRAEGMTPGVPDLHLPVARHGRHGLWIEMKKKAGRTSEAQTQWLERLKEEGHHTVICRSAREARDVIAWYVGIW